MPRKPRMRSSTDMYHITNRGINKNNIFNLENDKKSSCVSYKSHVYSILLNSIPIALCLIIFICFSKFPLLNCQPLSSSFPLHMQCIITPNIIKAAMYSRGVFTAKLYKTKNISGAACAISITILCKHVLCPLP